MFYITFKGFYNIYLCLFDLALVGETTGLGGLEEEKKTEADDKKIQVQVRQLERKLMNVLTRRTLTKRRQHFWLQQEMA